MENASTNVLSSASPAGQGVFDQTASPELRSRVRVIQSERRPSAVENKYVKKIPGFFERIADRFKDWKESRNETALKRSADRAVSTITHGLATGDFKKVYQGLKRLHNGEQKLSNMGGTVGALDKKTYIRERLQGVVSECLPDEKNSSASEKAKNLKRFAEDPDRYVDRHSDSKTLFHRMLTGLERAHLISHRYLNSRTERIEAQDNKIKDSLESMKACLLEKQANAGNTDAMHELGQCYQDGRGVNKNLEKAFRWFKQADDAGNSWGSFAIYDLGINYQGGYYGVGKNLEKAADMFWEAAYRGSSRAMYQLGVCYRDGKGVDQNDEKAASLFQQAAKRGSSAAMHELGVLYRDGLGGMDKNLEKAADMFRKAADRGYSAAMHELGVCYRDGKGVDKNLETAASLFQQAADSRYSPAMYQLGLCYRDGRGVDQDLEKAASLFQQAAVRGYSAAMNQ